MDKNKTITKRRIRRKHGIRNRIKGTPDRPRLTVHRTLQHIYCQVIDDVNGKTIAAASSRDKSIQDQVKSGGNSDAAAAIGKAVAEKAVAAGVKSLSFDRGSYKYHGRVAALANAVREAGISF